MQTGFSVSDTNGFTLVELIVIIFIAGILSVLAIPQFAAMDHKVSQSAVDGVAGALNSAAALNYAACRSNASACERGVNNCSAFGKERLLTGGLDTDYIIAAKSLGNRFGETVTCTVIHKPTGLSASFTGITP